MQKSEIVIKLEKETLLLQILNNAYTTIGSRMLTTEERSVFKIFEEIIDIKIKSINN